VTGLVAGRRVVAARLIRRCDVCSVLLLLLLLLLLLQAATAVNSGCVR